MLVDECKHHGHSMQVDCAFTLTGSNRHHLVAHVESVERHGLLHDIIVNFHMFNFISKNIVQRHNTEHAHLCGSSLDETGASFVNLSRIDIDDAVSQHVKILEYFAPKSVRIHFRLDFTGENLAFALSEACTLLHHIRCESPWHTLFSMPDGQVKHMPQCLLTPYGNIIETQFLDVGNGAEALLQRNVLQEHAVFYGCSRCSGVFSAIEELHNTLKSYASYTRGAA